MGCQFFTASCPLPSPSAWRGPTILYASDFVAVLLLQTALRQVPADNVRLEPELAHQAYSLEGVARGAIAFGTEESGSDAGGERSLRPDRKSRVPRSANRSRTQHAEEAMCVAGIMLVRF